MVIIMGAVTADYNNTYLSGNIEKDIALFKEIFKKDAAFRVKRINSDIKCAVIYMDGMVDSEQLNDAVISAVLTNSTPNEGLSLAEYLETTRKEGDAKTGEA